MEAALIVPPKPMSPSFAFRLLAQPLLLHLRPAAFRLFAATTTTLESETLTIPEPSTPIKPKPNGSTRSGSRSKKVVLDAKQLRLNWLESFSRPRSETDGIQTPDDSGPGNSDSGLVIGVNPDIFGALAVLKPDNSAEGWWSGGFGYGLWIGILVASGYSVVPVPSLLWKNGFKLAGKP